MPTIVYVDNDDEITSAAARIRATDAGPVALVVPSGSRLSTSRINFRLLAREAQTRGRRLSIVAADGGTRALAASAGLPVFGSVAEFESSTGEGTAGEGTAPAVLPAIAPALPAAAVPRPRPALPPARVPPDASATPPVVPPPVVVNPPWQVEPPRPPTLSASSAATVVIPAPAADRRRLPVGRPALAVALAALALALVVLGVAAYLFLPSATITVTPRREPIGPQSLSVRADPAATTSDASAGVVPAQRLTFDVAASDTFAVKGRRIEETKATGTVTFRSKDPTRENRIASGSVVSTSAGVRFRTTSNVILPRATFVGLTVIPGERSVKVEALKGGPEGNVAANAITVIPQNEDPILTDVRNRAPTTGGTRQEFPRIDQADVDAAVAQLTKQLGQDFETTIAEPTRIPAGLTAFPETKSLADPTSAVDPATLIGKEVDSFDLQMTSSGSVVAVDESLVTALVGERIRATVSGGHRLVDGSVQSEVGQPTVDGQIVTFPVIVRAAQAQVLDAATLLARVKGKPVPQARAALEPFGDVQVSVWPDWVTSIPTIEGRIQVRIVGPGSSPPASPATSGSPSPSGP